GGCAIQQRMTVKQDLWITLMGPLFGLINAVALMIVAKAIDSEWLFASGGIIAVINLTNLLPVPFMDGGIIANHLSFGLGKLIGTCCIVVQIIAVEFAYLATQVWWVGLFALVYTLAQVHNLIPWWGKSRASIRE